jgi:hypothetical protein
VGLGLGYADAKRAGEREAIAAGERLGVEVVVVNPAYVLGVPVDRTQPGGDVDADRRQLPARAAARRAEVGVIADLRERLGLPGAISAEAFGLMGQDWRFTSAKAKRELGTARARWRRPSRRRSSGTSS